MGRLFAIFMVLVCLGVFAYWYAFDYEVEWVPITWAMAWYAVYRIEFWAERILRAVRDDD